MDLNEKIAARRRELAREAEKVKREEDERIAAAARRTAAAISQQKQREKEALDAAVKRRLSEQGMEGIATPEPLKKQVDAQVEKLLDKAATDRMTTGENAIFFALVVFAILSFFVAWWLVVIFVVAIAIFMNKMTEKYKKQIIDESANARDLNAAVEERFGQSQAPTPASSQCKVCKSPVDQADSRCSKCFAKLS